MAENEQIVLASASPRRRELLTQVGVQFTVVPSTAPEEVLPDETPQAHVTRLSLAKAREVAARAEVAGRWFIGSDTVVVRDGVILGKPCDAADAAAMLRSLSGRSHRVWSGYAIIDRLSGQQEAYACVTVVTFKELTDAEIVGYIATGEPMDKAGAYAIQGRGMFMVRAIDGSYPNVVGLPVCEVVTRLEALGAHRMFGATETT
ncbi:MAG: Maf family protein [Desulfuromonadaceae bacterium]|nr:Maf family protein [Desulfuromonadaceae bacterium]